LIRSLLYSLPFFLQSHDLGTPSTKVVCTIGPVSRDATTLEGLLEEGMTVR
jgi:hypothetical protein